VLTGASYIFMQDKCIDTVGIEMIPRMKFGNTRKFTHFRCHVYFTSSLEYCIYCIPSLSVSFSSMYRTTYWMEIYGIFYNESNRHNGGATTYPSHCHITWDKKFMTFSILSWHMYSHLSTQFCDVSWYWLWRKMSVTN